VAAMGAGRASMEHRPWQEMFLLTLSVYRREWTKSSSEPV
jgi:hypothetical protein